MDSAITRPGEGNNVSREADRATVRELATWITEQLGADPYGEITVKVVLHDGKIARTERGVVRKSVARRFGLDAE